MWGYSARDVAQMLELPIARVRGFVRAGLVSPGRGSRGELRFSFQDLVLLRTAKGLREARVSPTRMRNALARLRRQLPAGKPLSGVHISAEDGRMVVRDGRTRWQPESGQVLFDFAIDELTREVAPLVTRARAASGEPSRRGGDVTPLDADDWYGWGCDLEDATPDQAREAYARALELDPDHADAHVNLGRLLHEAGDPKAALAHYQTARAKRPDDATASFNLGVALEDLERPLEAVAAYEAAVRADAGYADAHYNLAGLLERLGRDVEAFRHLKAYRKLRGR